MRLVSEPAGESGYRAARGRRDRFLGQRPGYVGLALRAGGDAAGIRDNHPWTPRGRSNAVPCLCRGKCVRLLSEVLRSSKAWGTGHEIEDTLVCSFN
jgi:hypothetical protein